MAITADKILSALEMERSAAQRGLPFKVVSSRRQGNLAILCVEPIRDGRSSTALDESLEGSRAVWFGEESGRGDVAAVNPENGEFALRFVYGSLPEEGARIALYPQDFITPLIDLWQEGPRRKNAAAVLRRSAKEPVAQTRTLPNHFDILRSRQAQAVSLPLNRIGLLHGPPGTGKTFTIGAMIAYLLTRFRNAKILVSGPTNTAVDSALISADDWLSRIGRDDLRQCMKRIGSRFDQRKYQDRDHLLAEGIYEASIEVSILELEEPPKNDIERYVLWKEKLDAARAKLKTDVAHISATSRVVAITTNSLFLHFESVANPGGGSWHFAIADEASQIMLPAALMVASLAKCCTFAGDPQQLAPIVQSADPLAQAVLGKTAFDVFKDAQSVFLNEQSRMCQGVCDIVSHTFYGDELVVCPKAARDPEWKLARSPWFLDGREIPRVLVDDRAGESTWSKRYNGKIRYASAEIAAALVHELLGSYVEPDDVLILTPFRAQRALIRSLLGRQGQRAVRVSTVHRAQGSERKIVIFDPVDAGSPFLNSETGRRLMNVAASRAQAHLIILVGETDLQNPYLAKMTVRARKLWDRKGDFASPLRVHLPQT
ncbi:AAA domain-containing protein [Ruegeria intermedia]|uniref:AAA domain-containing protein n=1 Tax=Ruegeria intermedia TaxID=996115 RepID=A0A1M5BQR3_9RHOB|nr:AAA domain-containing protein [Ruegeria intermedia]SHF44741.1 AAA domain-containing protein [Ruegeria intermedia]